MTDSVSLPPTPTPADVRVYRLFRTKHVRDWRLPREVATACDLTDRDARTICEALWQRGLLARIASYADFRYRVAPKRGFDPPHRAYVHQLLQALDGQQLVEREA